MRRTGTMTPDGHGGFNIVLSDPKNGVIEIIVKIGVSAVASVAGGALAALGSWGMQKIIEMKEKAEDKKA